MHRRRLLLSVAAAVVPLVFATVASSGPAFASGAGATGSFAPPVSAGHEFDAAPPANVAESVRYPTAVSVVAFPNGKVAYWNGLENLESAPYPIAIDGSRVSQGHNSRARIVAGNAQDGTVDLDSAGLDFAAPNVTVPEDGGGGDLFCADLRVLLNGSVLVAGGTVWKNDPVDLNDDPNDNSVPGGTTELFGNNASRILDQTGQWTQTAS